MIIEPKYFSVNRMGFERDEVPSQSPETESLAEFEAEPQSAKADIKAKNKNNEQTKGENDSEAYSHGSNKKTKKRPNFPFKINGVNSVIYINQK